MDWFKLSSKLPRDPRWKQLSPKAKVAYIEWACELAEHETDGVYYAGPKPPAYVAEFLAADLAEDRGGGYYFVPAFLKWNPTRADMDAKRNAGRKGAAARWQSESHANRKAGANAVPNAEVEVERDLETEPKAELRSVPGNPHQPTHDQLALADNLSDAITPGVIVMLNKRFGVGEVSDVLRSMHGFGANPEDWVAYLRGILNARREAM